KALHIREIIILTIFIFVLLWLTIFYSHKKNVALTIEKTKTMRIHFIAIGGSAMHNLAMALHDKGETITGSDDAIFEPSKSRLKAKGLLPDAMGWFPEKITADID